jgi:hypothetical protein
MAKNRKISYRIRNFTPILATSLDTFNSLWQFIPSRLEDAPSHDFALSSEVGIRVFDVDIPDDESQCLLHKGPNFLRL